MFLQISLMCGLMGGIWILTSASTITLLQYHMLHRHWKTPLYTHERIRVNRQTDILELS